MIVQVKDPPRTGCESLELCQPTRAPLGYLDAIGFIRIHKNRFCSSAGNFFVKQKAQWRQKCDGLRNRELLLGVKSSPPDFFHSLKNIRAVLRVDLADQLLP